MPETEFRYVAPADFDGIDRLLRVAFPGPDEAELTLRLRNDGVMWAEFVIESAGRIAAYAALSRMTAPEGWACLAPVATAPDLQAAQVPGAKKPRFGTRIVTNLVDWALDASGDDRPEAVVVLGEPGFYGRCGFSLARAQRLITPYPVAYTSIAGAGNDTPAETLLYPAAFDGL